MQNNFRNLMLSISYDGSPYHGWQVQKNAVTVQEVFQNALEKVLKETNKKEPEKSLKEKRLAKKAKQDSKKNL